MVILGEPIYCRMAVSLFPSGFFSIHKGNRCKRFWKTCKNRVRHQRPAQNPHGLNCEEEWSGRLDLNQRPHPPQGCAIPGFATSRPIQMRSGLYSFIRLSLAFEKRQESAQSVSQVQQHLPAQKLRGSLSSRTAGRTTASTSCARVLGIAILLAQVPPGASDRKPLVIQQPLNPQHHLHIFLPVKPVPARTLYRLKHGKFRLPIPQYERFQSGQPADLANPIKILFNRRLRCGSSTRHLDFL